MLPGPSQGLSPPLVPSRASVLGIWANHDASDRRPRVFDQPGNRRIYERPAAPMGFLLRPEDALAPPGALLRWAPACPPESRVFRSRSPLRTPGAVTRSARPSHVTGLSKSNLSRAAVSSFPTCLPNQDESIFAARDAVNGAFSSTMTLHSECGKHVECYGGPPRRSKCFADGEFERLALLLRARGRARTRRDVPSERARSVRKILFGKRAVHTIRRLRGRRRRSAGGLIARRLLTPRPVLLQNAVGRVSPTLSSVALAPAGRGL